MKKETSVNQSLFLGNAESDSIATANKGKHKFAWVENSFNQEISPHLDHAVERDTFLGKSVDPNKTRRFFWLLLLGVWVLFGRIFYLQIWQGNTYRTLAEGNRLRVLPVLAERGIIYDHFNTELVQNIPSFTLSIIPQDLPRSLTERTAILSRVADMSSIPMDEITAALKKYRSAGYQSLTVKENLNYESALTLYAENADLPGVVIDSATKRFYPATSEKISSSTPSLSHLLGYVGKINDQELSRNPNSGYLLSDTIGKSGLEKSYESALRGTLGKKKIEVDARGKEQTVLAIDPPKPGQNLILTLDLEAQRVRENSV